MKLEDIKTKKVLVFGDYMVDKYIVGKVKRISPEAPVPIIEVTKTQTKLGGAGNVINNILAFGASVKAIGCIGLDKDGDWLLSELKNKNADISFMIQSKELETITKTRVVSDNHQFLRYDVEEIKPLPEMFFNTIAENINKILENVDSIVISDYNKGAVNEEIAQLLVQSANKLNIPIIVDPKGKNYNKYNGATICTPNTNELSIISDENLNSEESIKKAGVELCENCGFNHLLLTRSEKGISLFNKDENFKTDFPAVPKEVIDVTGAGDTVVSIVALLYASGFSIEECCRMANVAASVSISKFGASVVTFNELLSALYTRKNKIIDTDFLEFIINIEKQNNKKIIFTNGCFDLFHYGHLQSLLKAKSLGDILIVAVNSDNSVRINKGDLRPIVSEDNRMEILSALECVDYVIKMNDTTPVNLINLIKPDISVKGSNWKDKYIPEKEVIESYGGRIEFIDLQPGFSTTDEIKKILTLYGK